MDEVKVGAGILSIITESLYDNPIVVFREYVQNSMDSILKSNRINDIHEIRIWSCDNKLFFLDNGIGIEKEKFRDEMKKIGASSKKKQKNLGYKGIGRLSGIPYCKTLEFINIIDYKKGVAQSFKIDCETYEMIKNEEKYSEMTFSELIESIGKYDEIDNIHNEEKICKQLEVYDELLKKSNTGFYVVLNEMSEVLKNTIDSKNFLDDLQWLLPIDYSRDLYESDKHELFEELTNDNGEGRSVNFCKIYYNGNELVRPIRTGMLRNYVGKINLKYAVGFHTFNKEKIAIDRGNEFSGIKVYIDNMLLCDETELLQSLEHYNLLAHTSNGQIQSVRGIGAMIYITDKVNISANARRTFVEVTDSTSLEFLKILAEYVNAIYDTRYALSNYISARNKYKDDYEKIDKLKRMAFESLMRLARDDIRIPDEEVVGSDFSSLEIAEKKKIIKKKITHELEQKIQVYLKQLEEYNYDTAYIEFIEWLKNQE